MGLFRKFGSIFGFTDSDEENEDYNGEPEEDEDTDDEDEEDEERGSIFDRFFGGRKKNSGGQSSIENPAPVQPPPKKTGHVREGNIIIDSRLTAEAEVLAEEHRELVVRVHQIDECREIIKYLLAGDSVLLNLENVDPKDCGRIVDLLSGAAFALSGTMVKVAHLSYLLAPANVKVIEMNGYGMNSRSRYQ